MQQRKKQQAQTYNDGLVSFYGIPDGADAGDDEITLTLKQAGIHYEKRMVGMSRFWAAGQTGTRIDKLIRVPFIPSVFREDIAVLEDGEQYDIKQIQEPPDVMPKSMDLSLERLTSRQKYTLPVGDDHG